MARFEEEREDRLRDAVALVPRAEFTAPNRLGTVSIFAGFRGQSLSLYFGSDPVYHFNSAKRLRRAYVDNRLLKAERGRLVAMTRQRTPTEVILESEFIDHAIQQTILADLSARLQSLALALNDDDFELRGEVPPDGAAIAQLGAWLQSRCDVEIALSPHVR